MADVKRFNSKNGIENGTQESNLSMSDILISQHITGDNNDYKLTLAQAQAIPYGVCESLGDEDKTVNLINYPSTYTAQVGNKVLIKFIHANTKGHVSDNTYPTLTVGGVTKPIAAQGKTIGAGAIVDDQIIELVLTPDYWNIDQNIREVTSAYTILTDGSYIYNKTQIDNNNYTKAQTDSAINGALADYNKSIGFNDTSATDKEELVKNKALIAINNGLKNYGTFTLAGGWQGKNYGYSIISRSSERYFVLFYGNTVTSIIGCYNSTKDEVEFAEKIATESEVLKSILEDRKGITVTDNDIDLNNLKTIGKYNIFEKRITNGCEGLSLGNTFYGYIEVISTARDNVLIQKQIATLNGTVRIAYRYLGTSGVWNDWKEFV